MVFGSLFDSSDTQLSTDCPRRRRYFLQIPRSQSDPSSSLFPSVDRLPLLLRISHPPRPKLARRSPLAAGRVPLPPPLLLPRLLPRPHQRASRRWLAGFLRPLSIHRPSQWAFLFPHQQLSRRNSSSPLFCHASPRSRGNRPCHPTPYSPFHWKQKRKNDPLRPTSSDMRSVWRAEKKRPLRRL